MGATLQITVDHSRCEKCGLCIRYFQGYCITEKNGYPVFNASLCNTCQKCVAICPARAILVNRTLARRLNPQVEVTPQNLLQLMQRRRSIKRFLDKPLQHEQVLQIVQSASTAPNQNKNIRALIITNPGLLSEINEGGMRFVHFFYNLLFGIPFFSGLMSRLSRDFQIIRTKMEYDLKLRRQVLKPNTQALVVLLGPKSVPVTAASAHYLLSAMIMMAESMGIGSCLMDSLRLTLTLDKKVKKLLGLNSDVLGVLALGYSAEPIVNVPQGYELEIFENHDRP